MRRTTDIHILGSDGRPLAAIEVKNLPQLSVSTAEALRDSLAQRVAEPPPYVLVVSEAAGYIWSYDRASHRFSEAEPIDLRPIFSAYASLAPSKTRLRGADLELMLSAWLGEVTRHLDGGWPNAAGRDGLFGRFLSSLRGARVILEPAA